MAKYDFDVAVAFAPQTAEGTYDTTLDAISATLDGDPDATDDGLVLGDPESGIRQSGLDFRVGRRRREKAFVGSSFTRPLDDFLAAEVRTFSFSFPFCGNRGTTTATPVDGDFQPLRGIEAILNGAGIVAAAWGSGVGYSCKFGSPNPFSALIYYFGNRLELLDCRCSSLTIDFTPGSIAVATAEIQVGSIKDPAATPVSVVSLPTLDYGPQATVSAPTIESVANGWSATRGFSTLALTISPSIQDFGDSNATDGIVKEQDDRETTIEATLYADDAGSGEVYELDQIFQTSSGGLDQLSFQVGTDASGSDPALATQILVPQPMVDETGPDPVGSKAANTVNLIARNDAANDELEIIFR